MGLVGQAVAYLFLGVNGHEVLRLRDVRHFTLDQQDRRLGPEMDRR